MIIDVLMICFAVSFIVDVSGFIDTAKRFIWHRLFRKLPYREYSAKPFDCSLCMTFWAVFIYLAIAYGFSLLALFVACVAAFSAEIVTAIILTIKDIILKLLSKL